MPQAEPERVMLSTSRARQLLAWLSDFRAERGYGPSVREMAAGIGTSSSRAYQLLVMLEADGLVTSARAPRTVVPAAFHDRPCPYCKGRGHR